jgi:hypothetical protein
VDNAGAAGTAQTTWKRANTAKAKGQFAVAKNEKQRKQQAAYMRKRRADQKAFINDWKLRQMYCYDCGWEITPERLPAIDCDHIDPQTKRYSISDQAGAIPWEALALELEKCQARCRNCHAIRTMNEGHWYYHNEVKQSAPSPQGDLFQGWPDVC